MDHEEKNIGSHKDESNEEPTIPFTDISKRKVQLYILSLFIFLLILIVLFYFAYSTMDIILE